MAVETISAFTALIIAVSVVLTAVFNARKGAEDILRDLVNKQGIRIAELEQKIENRDKDIEERDAKIEELERRVNTLSSELQKITHPKIKTRVNRKKLNFKE